MKKITVITVNYNNIAGLKHTIASVASQSFRDFEYIVIDGGSTDGSIDIIKQYSEHVDFWVSEKDSGVYNAMNKGIDHANGEYVLFMNSGDSFYSDSVLDNVIGQLDSDIVCGNANLGKEIWHSPKVLDSNFLLNRFSICHQSTFIRTSILKQTPYNEAFRIVADYCSLLVEIVANKRSYKGIDQIICNYDCNGLSSNNAESDTEKIRVLDYLRYQGIIEEDELLMRCKKLKRLGIRYKFVLAFVRFLDKV